MQKICRICKKICKICKTNKNLNLKFVPKYAKYVKKYAKYVSQNLICRICTPHFADEVAQRLQRRASIWAAPPRRARKRATNTFDITPPWRLTRILVAYSAPSRQLQTVQNQQLFWYRDQRPAVPRAPLNLIAPSRPTRRRPSCYIEHKYNLYNIQPEEYDYIA